MKKFPNINAHLCWKIVFMGSMCFCFDSFKTRQRKYSEAEHTEKSCVHSGIDRMNITRLSFRRCIPESLKMPGDAGERGKVHRKLSWGSPHTARGVVSSQMPVPGGYTLVSPTCQLPSSLLYIKQIFKVSWWFSPGIRGWGSCPDHILSFKEANVISGPQSCARKLSNILQFSQCTITELLILLPLCSPEARKLLSHTCGSHTQAHKNLLSPCLSKLRLETYYSTYNNMIIYKLSGQFTIGRLRTRQDKFVKMNWEQDKISS